MKTSLFAYTLLALPLCLGSIACGASTAEGAEAAEAAEQDLTQTRTSVIFGEEDDGATATVREGQSVVVELPSNPSTGFAWKVVSTDRTFGYPASEEFVPDGGGVGVGGTTVLTWKTQSPLSMLGRHSVRLEYRRPWDESGPAAKTFTFTVDIVDATTAVSGVTFTDADNGRTLDVRVGNDVVVELESNPSTGYSWNVTMTDRTFGYPQEEFVPPAITVVGAPGKQRFTWKTNGPLPMIGSHTVVLSYARPWEPDRPAKTFSFTVNITP